MLDGSHKTPTPPRVENSRHHCKSRDKDECKKDKQDMAVESVRCTTSKGEGAYLVAVDASSAPPFLVSLLCKAFNMEVDAADTCPLPTVVPCVLD